MSIVGTLLGCEHCACSCRDVRCGSVVDVHLNDVSMKDFSKKSCCLRKMQVSQNLCHKLLLVIPHP